MKRPDEHVKRDRAIQIFKGSVPSEWVPPEEFDHDYGLDLHIRIRNENAILTGEMLLVQVKGYSRPRIVGNSISSVCSVRHMKLWSIHRDPVILVVVDLNKKKCYWVHIQKFVRYLNIHKPLWDKKKYVTVKVPIENEVTSSVEGLKEVAAVGSGDKSIIIEQRVRRLLSSSNIPYEDLLFLAPPIGPGFPWVFDGFGVPSSERPEYIIKVRHRVDNPEILVVGEAVKKRYEHSKTILVTEKIEGLPKLLEIISSKKNWDFVVDSAKLENLTSIIKLHN